MSAAKPAVDKLVAIMSKVGTCDAIAADITKFAKENQPLFLLLNTEEGKLTDDQQAPAADLENQLLAGLDQSKLIEAIKSGPIAQCVVKKDKKMMAAMEAMDKAITSGSKGATAPPPVPPPPPQLPPPSGPKK